MKKAKIKTFKSVKMTSMHQRRSLLTILSISTMLQPANNSRFNRLTFMRLIALRMSARTRSLSWALASYSKNTGSTSSWKSSVVTSQLIQKFIRPSSPLITILSIHSNSSTHTKITVVARAGISRCRARVRCQAAASALHQRPSCIALMKVWRNRKKIAR